MMRLTQLEVQRRKDWRKPCEVCGAVFGWSKNGDKARYCSRTCAGKANGAISTPRGGRLQYVCAECRSPFDVYYKSRKFCSRSCSDKGKERPMGYACKVDANHAEVVAALRAVGASIIDTSRLGQGMPDLIVGYRGMTLLIEVKNPKTQYGRRGLNKNQRAWAETWRGGALCVVDGPDAALRALGVVNE